MIEINQQDGFLIYVFLTMGLLCWACVREMWRARVQSWNVSEAQLEHCRDCSLAFLVHGRESRVRCPRCGALCSIRRR